MTDQLLSKIDAYLMTAANTPTNTVTAGVDTFATATPTAAQTAEAATIRAALSGAFGEAIEVFIGDGADEGSYLAQVPLQHLKATGIKLVESIVPRRSDGTGSSAVIGSPEAVVNAENRVSKPLGEGWRAKLDSFPAHAGAPAALYFRVTKTP